MNLLDRDEIKDKILNFVEEMIAETGLPYKRKNLTWYFDKPDFVTILNLQRSMEGSKYSVNIMIALRGAHVFKYPKANQGDIRYKISDEQGADINIDFERGDSFLDLKRAVADFAIPTILTLNSKDDLKNLYEKIKHLKSLDLTPEGRAVLNLS